MKIVVAPNAFKESLTAREVARAVEKGLRRALPRAEIVCVPIADGGDGTLDVLVRGTGGRVRLAQVRGPLGDAVRARYGISGYGRTGVVEMAEASGLRLLDSVSRNPMRSNTFGTGELIGRVLDCGVERVIVGVGGSATVDGGVGMAAALGYRFFDGRGRELPPVPEVFPRIRRIDSSGWEARRRALGEKARIVVASDVTNPLLGARGAARVFGPQKGASPRDVPRLEEGLSHLADLWKSELGVGVRRLRGGGAAGGLGAGLAAFLGATIKPGAERICEAVGLPERLRGADWVVTGEGRLDTQTREGKAPVCAARMARKAGAKVLALAGSVAPDADGVLSRDFDAVLSICDGPILLDDAMRRAGVLVERAARAAGALMGGRISDRPE